MDDLTHQPARPSWDCTGCPDGTAWPCDTAREQLAGLPGWDLVTLTAYMSELWAVAGPELGRTVTPVEVYGRFLGWCRAAMG
ncbi:hypothetical protein [Micromonospora sp. NPDC004704]